MTTEYVILKRQNLIDPEEQQHVSAWAEVAEVASTSARTAIRLALDGRGDDKAGTYAAIPKRSWAPVAVAVDTKTVVTLT